MIAETIAKTLGGRKAGGAWMVCCPAHEDREPSLSITDARGGKVLVRCHAGCDQRNVIAALRSRGAWETAGRQEGRFRRKVHRRLPDDPDPDALKRTEAALAIWQASQPAEGTPVETYLRHACRACLFKTEAEARAAQLDSQLREEQRRRAEFEKIRRARAKTLIRGASTRIGGKGSSDGKGTHKSCFSFNGVKICE